MSQSSKSQGAEESRPSRSQSLLKTLGRKLSRPRSAHSDVARRAPERSPSLAPTIRGQSSLTSARLLENSPGAGNGLDIGGESLLDDVGAVAEVRASPESVRGFE
jgi:hypothetical protein